MFNFTEKLVMTFFVGFILALFAGLGFHFLGIEDVVGMCLGGAIVSLTTGIVIGAVSLLKYLWFDA